MNAQVYTHIVLEPVAIPYFQQLEKAMFQHDNARAHTAAVTTRFLCVSQDTVLEIESTS